MPIHIWKDKEGKKVTAKEFVTRFKEGVGKMTPIQKAKNEVRSTFTMFVGYFFGLISLIIYREAFVVQWFTYALIIIFLGASWSNGIRWFALRQQLKLLKKIDEESVDIENLFDNLEPINKKKKGGNK